MPSYTCFRREGHNPLKGTSQGNMNSNWMGVLFIRPPFVRTFVRRCLINVLQYQMYPHQFGLFKQNMRLFHLIIFTFDKLYRLCISITVNQLLNASLNFAFFYFQIFATSYFCVYHQLSSVIYFAASELVTMIFNRWHFNFSLLDQRILFYERDCLWWLRVTSNLKRHLSPLVGNTKPCYR